MVKKNGSSIFFKNPDLYSSLTLAYIGDAVFELYARSKIISEIGGSIDKMHKETSQYVKAGTQAAMYHEVIQFLTEKEIAVLKRGRNAKSNSKSKNSSMSDYRHATGLEALFGYLYIKGDVNRLRELLEICFSLDSEPIQ